MAPAKKAPAGPDRPRGRGRADRDPTRKLSQKPRKKSSGPTQSDAARRARGLVRITMWLPAAVVERLDKILGDQPRVRAIEKLIENA